MKRIIAMALCVLMLLTLFVGCGKNEALESAKAYLENMYQTGSKDEPMNLMSDKEVLTVVTVDGKTYDVEWSVEVTEGDKEAVKVSESDKENTAVIDIPDLPESDILFTAIATIKDKKNSVEAKFDYKVMGLNVAGGDAETILNDAYALKDGEKMDAPSTLTGKITKIDTPYSAQYKNITVTMVVDGFDDKPIQCYRLKGNGADKLAVGDTITVTGTIINYKGKVQFDAGSEINTIVKADGTTTNNSTNNSGTTSNNNGGSSNTNNSGSNNNSGTTNNNNNGGSITSTNKTAAQIVAEAYALADGQSLPYIATLTGKVNTINFAFEDVFGGQISVTMTVENKDIYCYKMKGSGVDKVAVGDTITVSGVIKNYGGTIEFAYDANSGTEVTMNKRVAGSGSVATLSVVTNPVPGTAYKFGMVQENMGNSIYYFKKTGETAATYYLASAQLPDAAMDVYLEETTGGYYLYGMVNGTTKKYLNMSVNGTHVNAVLGNTPTTVYTYDATLQTMVSTQLDKPYAFGNHSTYTNISTTDTTKSGFVCKFYK